MTYKSHGLEWERGELLAQAKESCWLCHGYGLTRGRGDGRVCNCVLRSIFKEVYRRFRAALFIQASSCSRVTRVKQINFYRKNEEFVADLQGTARKFLTLFESRVFHWHFVMGRDWRFCCERLKLNRGQFFHHVYRIQAKMALVYKKEAMWPTRGYFGGVVNSTVTAQSVLGYKDRPSFRVPIKEKKDEMLLVASAGR